MKTFIAESSIILIFITVASTNFQGNSCRTPDNFDGTCVRLNLCPPLYKLALSPQLTSQQQNFLRESRCGFQLNYPLVCCRNRFNDLPTPGNCGVQAKDRIVGGEETSIQDYPWMALLQYRNRQGVNIGFLCGGVLIHKNYVLTAAHCIRGMNIIQNGYSIVTVRLGEHDLRSEEDCQENECALPVVNIPVLETFVHENYRHESGTKLNDIALIRLAQDAQYTDFVRPICLPVASYLHAKNFDNIPMLVAGFGKTENASRSDVKLQLELHGYNLNQCQIVYGHNGYSIGNTHLCAGGEKGRSSCQGDSGGPLMADDLTHEIHPYTYLVGIVSFGPARCGVIGYPGVYTRVDKYIDWILDNMKH